MFVPEAMREVSKLVVIPANPYRNALPEAAEPFLSTSPRLVGGVDRGLPEMKSVYFDELKTSVTKC